MTEVFRLSLLEKWYYRYIKFNKAYRDLGQEHFDALMTWHEFISKSFPTIVSFNNDFPIVPYVGILDSFGRIISRKSIVDEFDAYVMINDGKLYIREKCSVFLLK